MLASRWSLLSPLVLLAWACGQTPDDTGGNNGGTGNAAGSGNPSGGVVNGGTSGAATGGVSGTPPTGGMSGTPPTGGSGGTPPTGGSGGVAGSGVTGGTGGTAGSGMSGSSTGGTGGSATCTITPTSSTAMRIPTVGIVTFTTDLAGMTGANIEFGRDTTYGMTAPVDLTAMNYRTLLLGMKASTMYHYRIVATGPNGTCTGGDNTITTGALATGLPTFDVTPETASGLAGGFLITGQYQGSGGSGAPAYIIDADGDIVWWYITGQRDVTNVRPSYDGKYMWIQNANVPGPNGAIVHRVSMDGAMDEDLSSDFARASHSFTVLPDESVVFYAYGSNNCDDIKERTANGMVRTIVNSQAAHGASGPCHVNHIEYSAEDDTILFSDLDNDNITKIRRTNGETVWVLGGETSDFTGMTTWDRQHGIDVLGLDRLVFFNNAGNTGSIAVEILLNLTGMSATQPWTYRAQPAIANQVMGDVQRLENGNTLVAYSTQGVVHEVNAMGQLLQEINWPLGGAFGYVQKRKSLYGPPPR